MLLHFGKLLTLRQTSAGPLNSPTEETNWQLVRISLLPSLINRESEIAEFGESSGFPVLGAIARLHTSVVRRNMLRILR